MKATKSQLAELNSIAEEMNVPMADVLSTMNSVSAAMYKAIGARGVVESAWESHQKGLALSLCEIVRATEKAYLINCKLMGITEKWIPISVVKNGIIPSWVLNR